MADELKWMDKISKPQEVSAGRNTAGILLLAR
jgi:hypothetical protein